MQLLSSLPKARGPSNKDNATNSAFYDCLYTLEHQHLYLVKYYINNKIYRNM